MREGAYLGLRAGDATKLGQYVATQLASLFPASGLSEDIEALASILPAALIRMSPILKGVRAFQDDFFDHFNTLQYATFLYLLANEEWRRAGASALADRLFCLNRALNALDLFYAVELPPVFFLSHALGAVIGNATYGDRLVIFQGVTVGRVGDARPTLGRNIVLFPGSSVTGAARVEDGCVLAAGVHVSGANIPANSLVRQGPHGLIVERRRRDYLSLYLNQTALSASGPAASIHR